MSQVEINSDALIHVLTECVRQGATIQIQSEGDILYTGNDVAKAIEEIKSVDICDTFIQRAGHKDEWLLAIMENGPEENVSDFTTGGLIAEVWDAWFKVWG